MSKTKLEHREAIHLVALEVALVASQALKGSMTNLDNKEELEVHHLEIYLTSLKSSSEDSKVEIGKEEVQEELLPEVRI